MEDAVDIAGPQRLHIEDATIRHRRESGAPGVPPDIRSDAGRPHLNGTASGGRNAVRPKAANAISLLASSRRERPARGKVAPLADLPTPPVARLYSGRTVLRSRCADPASERAE